MIGSGAVPLIVLVAVVGGFVSLVALWIFNYSQTGDTEDATERTSGTVVGAISGVVFGVVIVLSTVGDALGVVGDFIATFPNAIGQFVLGGLAVLGFSGWVEIGTVGATVLVVVIIAGVAAVRN